MQNFIIISYNFVMTFNCYWKEKSHLRKKIDYLYFETWEKNIKLGLNIKSIKVNVKIHNRQDVISGIEIWEKNKQGNIPRLCSLNVCIVKKMWIMRVSSKAKQLGDFCGTTYIYFQGGQTHVLKKSFTLN